VKPLFYSWDALYNFIGSQDDKLYFLTTRNAPLRRVILVDARQPATTSWPTVVTRTELRTDEASYVGGMIVAKYVEMHTASRACMTPRESRQAW